MLEQIGIASVSLPQVTKQEHSELSEDLVPRPSVCAACGACEASAQLVGRWLVARRREKVILNRFGAEMIES